MPAAPFQFMSTDPLKGAVQILQDRLYYAALKSPPVRSSTVLVAQNGGQKSVKKQISYFSIDNELVYWNFFLDFGPLNLGQLYRFCAKLNDKLEDDRLANRVVCYYSSSAPTKRANAAFLICAWQVLYLNRTPEEAFRGFQNEIVDPVAEPSSPGAPSNCSSSHGGSGYDMPVLQPFHDASPCACTYELTVLDCLRGLAKAREYRYFDFDKFDVEEYEYFEQVENGDLNWIMKDKILAFAGPHHRRNVTPEGYCTLTPADYIPYFQRKDVSLVVRLNKKCYDEGDFRKAGIEHFEQYYLDGSCPPMKILQSVLEAFESVPAGKGFAVHCKAGLGRTGTCIGAYMMKHYKFTAAEAIGWMRICRPGMVIGPQQHFLQDIEQRMWHEGSVMSMKPQHSLQSRSLLKSLRSGKEGGRKSEKYDQSEQGGMVITKLSPPFESLTVEEQQRQNAEDAKEGQGTSLLARRTQVQHQHPL